MSKPTGKDVKVVNMPKDDLTPAGTVDIPPPPNFPDKGSEKYLYDTQQAGRVERLMLRGVRNDQFIMQELEIKSESKLKRYKEMVYARWQLIGSDNDLKVHRGEALNRLDMISAELWKHIDQCKEAKEISMMIKNLITIEQTRNGLIGLHQKAIERMQEKVTDVQIAFSQRTETHQALASVAARALEMLEEGEDNDKPPES